MTRLTDRAWSPSLTRALIGLPQVSGFQPLGARLADGRTSGHRISGMAQLAVSGFVGVGAMFAGGIATAMMLRAVR